MSTESNSDVVEIRALIERWAQAVRDRDIPAILAHHSADILMFDVPPPTLLRGLEAYERSFYPLFDSFGDHGVWQVRDVVVHASDSVAFATALIDCVGRESLEVRFTVGLRKLGGRWTVVHEHYSVPSP
jgi:ketosteroid isomerase-like protein